MIMQSDVPVKVKYNSIGAFLANRAADYPQRAVIASKRSGRYESIAWAEFYLGVRKMMRFFKDQGCQKGQHVVIFSPNGVEMLQIELAAMSMGLVSVPLFAGYKQNMANKLVKFSEGSFLCVADKARLDLLEPDSLPASILLFSDEEVDLPGVSRYSHQMAMALTENDAEWSQRILGRVDRDDRALLMYTSGTMGFPKGVQLTHGNILSQQEALEAKWGVEPGGTLLSFLPWHHSFGGIFEKFFALYSGTQLALDDSRGKDMDRLVSNWRQLMPNFFFSVPKVFQEVITRTANDPRFEDEFFHPDLKFVFTAGAPLSDSVSRVFRSKAVPVLEGWGLTETSPCCTLTDGKSDRLPGIVGHPMPGVAIGVDEEGELLVKGPNIMLGYFKNDKANAGVFAEGGWFRTGDLGELTDDGVRILTRKDRIFKLANAEKVNPTVIENDMLGTCPLLKHVVIFGSGLERVCALVFPNIEQLHGAGCAKSEADPHNVGELSECLTGCLSDLNHRIAKRYERIGTFIVVERELEIDKGELTPSMKVNPASVFKNFAGYLKPVFEPGSPKPEDAIYVDLEALSHAI